MTATLSFFSGGFRSKVKIVTAQLFATPPYFCWQLAFYRHLPTSGRQNTVKTAPQPLFVNRAFVALYVSIISPVGPISICQNQSIIFCNTDLFLLATRVLPASPNFGQAKHGQNGPRATFCQQGICCPICEHHFTRWTHPDISLRFRAGGRRLKNFRFS